MRRILLFLFLFVPFNALPQMVLGYYYGNYSGYPHDMIEYNCLTHIAHAFIIPDSTGEISYEEWFLYPELIEAARQNGKKIVVSVGGWGNSDGFKGLVKEPRHMVAFIRNLVRFIKEHGYDGADIDWEYPTQNEKWEFASLLVSLRRAFNEAGIELLSVALPAIDWHNVFDASTLNNTLDWVGIMTYDFYGPWEKTTGHNTALYSTPEQILSLDHSIKHYLQKGVLPTKLCAGMEFVGYKFNATGLHKPHTGARSIPYNKAMDLLNEGWEYTWDDAAKVPYLFQPDSLQFITIDDALSIEYKSRYILDHNLAGTIIWKLGFDYRNGFNELLNLVGDNLLSDKPGKPELIYPCNNDIIGYNTPFEWTSVRGFGKYQIQMSSTPDFENVHDMYTNDTIYKANINGYWRVRGINMNTQSEWSEVRRVYNINNSGSVIIYNMEDSLIVEGFLHPDYYYSLKIYDLYFSKEIIITEGYSDYRIKRVVLPFANTPVIMSQITNNILVKGILVNRFWSNIWRQYDLP
jgi:chitinase